MIKKSGSTKDIEISEDGFFFSFTDRYSIYDWGEMPDSIQGKGVALHQLALYFYKLLQEHNIETAFVNSQKDKIQLRNFAIYPPQKIHQEYSYPKPQEVKTSYLIPLEVIFRFGAPKGSSLLRRNTGEKVFYENQMWDEPLIEYSTKLEKKDRYLETSEAKEISLLTEDEFDILTLQSKRIAKILKEDLASKDILLWDGKLEFAYDKSRKSLVLVDSIGMDELRMEHQGISLSKEFLRQCYSQSLWLSELRKQQSIQPISWKHYLEENSILPQPLRVESLKLASEIYLHSSKLICNGTPPPKEFLHRASLYKKKHQVLVLGDGGREHCLAEQMALSPLVDRVFIVTKKTNIYAHPKIAVCSLSTKEEVCDFSKTTGIDLIVIGPETFLEQDYATYLRSKGLLVFGPSYQEARLESSKVYAKNLMLSLGIQTPSFEFCENNSVALKTLEAPSSSKLLVLKEDGLAAGKGVLVAEKQEEIRDHLLNQKLETSWLLEEKISGQELSAFAIFDASGFRYLGTACDYKRIRDGNQGPNTGGMGTYSPCDWLSPEEERYIIDNIFLVLHKHFQKNQIDFRGVVFAGLMKTKEGIYTLEFNTRFGDPETQSLLPRIKNDLFLLLSSCASSNIALNTEIEFLSQSNVHLIYASAGYPGTEGQEILLGQQLNINQAALQKQGLKIYYSGANREKETWTNVGGRVLGITATDHNRPLAIKKLYNNTQWVQFEGMQFRNDIGK